MRRLRTRTVVLMVIAAAAATLFVRLGLWQLDRLDDRRSRNAVRSARSELATVRVGGGVAALPLTAADSLRWRRALIEGHWVYEHEFLLRARARDGHQGVEVVTPLRTDTADPGADRGVVVLVLRGWLPARDGLTPDLSRGTDDSGSRLPVRVRGVLEAPPPPRNGVPRTVSTPAGERLAYTSLNLDDVRRRTGLTVAPLYLRATEVTAPYDDIELSVGAPYDDGPHLSYALQWFAFAVISLVGTGAIAFKEVRER